DPGRSPGRGPGSGGQLAPRLAAPSRAPRTLSRWPSVTDVRSPTPVGEPTLGDRIAPGAGPDEVVEVFLDWVADRGLELYPAQEEALLEVAAGSHVIVNTPTGSGKSLIAVAAHAVALADGRRTFYTAPIKALV